MSQIKANTLPFTLVRPRRRHVYAWWRAHIPATTQKPKTSRYLRPHRMDLLRALAKFLRLSDAGYDRKEVRMHLYTTCPWGVLWERASWTRCRYSIITSWKLIDSLICQANISKNMTRSLWRRKSVGDPWLSMLVLLLADIWQLVDWAELITLDLAQYEQPGGKEDLVRQLDHAVRNVGESTLPCVPGNTGVPSPNTTSRLHFDRTWSLGLVLIRVWKQDFSMWRTLISVKKRSTTSLP